MLFRSGTPGYMAPEHIDGDKAGPEADMFAWAATMVFAATGRRAFPGSTVSAVALAVLHKEPELDGLEGDLADIVRACLEKDPAKRPTAAEVSDRLRDLHTSEPVPVETEPQQRPPAPAAKPRRRRLVVVGAPLAILTLIGVFYLPFRGGGEGGVSQPPPKSLVATSKGPAASPSEESSKSPSPTGSKSQESRRPHASPTASKEEPPSGRQPSKRPPKSGPRTLGTLTTQDYEGYCRSHGYPYYVVFADQGVCSKDRDGTNGTIASPTTVCQWKHSDQPNVHANGRTCVSDP
mgnify:CR=1 FL=1